MVWGNSLCTRDAETCICRSFDVKLKTVLAYVVLYLQ